MSCQYAHTAGMPPSDMYPRAGRAATRLLYASHQLHPSHQLYPLHPLQTGQRLLVLHADSLVDGELTGYTATGRPLVRIGTGEVIEVDLNHCNHCVQRFKSVVQYREAAEDYRAHVQRSSAFVEDAITGRSLRVRDPEPAAPHRLWQTTVTAPLPCRTRHRRLR